MLGGKNGCVGCACCGKECHGIESVVIPWFVWGIEGQVKFSVGSPCEAPFGSLFDNNPSVPCNSEGIEWWPGLDEWRGTIGLIGVNACAKVLVLLVLWILCSLGLELLEDDALTGCEWLEKSEWGGRFADPLMLEWLECKQAALFELECPRRPLDDAGEAPKGREEEK